MKKIFVLFILVQSVSICSAQTNVSGNQSGTWTAANSPYQVIDEILVPNGETLNIEPGVEINFQGHYKFIVNGLLQAVGTQTDSIRFTTNNPLTGWGGIRLDETDGVNILAFCRIEFGKTSGDYPDIHGGGLALLSSDAEVSNCVFADNNATADENGMGGAVYAINTGSPSNTLSSFTDCKFIRNHAYGEGGAIKFTSDMNTEIIGCEFVENDCNYGGGAISFYTVLNTKMTTCLFVDNYTMYSNGGAIHTLGFDNSLVFENCTIYGNSAISGDGGGVNLVYCDANFVNCIIKNNDGMYSDDVFLGLGGTAEINYSNLIMPADATGANNINVDSEFVDVTNFDFHLLETSPCIDAGIDIGLPYEDEAPDLGCFEYQQNIGIIDLETEEIIIFPNPTNGIFRIQTKFTIQSIRLINILGEVVFSKNLNGNNFESIDISQLIKGTYFIQIVTNNNITFTNKIIFSY